MAFSFFSGKKSSDQEDIGNSPRISAVVHTMKEDIENMKNNSGKISAFTQNKQREESQKSTQKVSTMSVNPFSEEGEKLFQSQAENKTENPFGVTAQPQKDSSPKYPPQQNIKTGLAPITLEGELLSDHLQGKKAYIW